MAVAPPRKRWGTSFNRQLPKQFLGRLPIAASPRPRARGGLLLLTGIPDLPVAGHSRRSDRGPAASGPPRSTDILSARRHVSKVPTRDMHFAWLARSNRVAIQLRPR